MGHKLNIKLINKIAALEEKRDAIKVSMEDSIAAQELVKSLFSRMGSDNPPVAADWEAMDAAPCEKANIQDEIEMLEGSLDLDLELVETRYLIVDGGLVSPAGFHPSERVFVKGDVFIMTNKLPRSLSGNLIAYYINKIASA